MSPKSNVRRAADVMVESFRAHGVDRIFCVPGESYLALLDALHDAPDIDLVAARHEGGAGFMALADAKITGRAGVCAVSRGPGATNASIAVHMAEQDAVPLVLLIGQVARADLGRGAFQEIDYAKAFGAIAKGVWEVRDAEQLPEVLARAFHLALSETPGPCVIALPEDMLSDAVAAEVVAPLPLAQASPSARDIEAAIALLAESERPLVIAGGRATEPAGRATLQAAAEAHDLAVALAFKRQDGFPNDHPNFAGYLGFKIPPAQVEAMAEADLILAVGARLNDTTTQGYRLPRAPEPEQPLIHVHPDPDKIGTVFRTTLGLAVDPVAFLEALADRGHERVPARKTWLAGLNERARALVAYTPSDPGDGVDFGAVVAAIARQAAADAVVITDAGNFGSWVHRHWPWQPGNLLLGLVGGAMGFGVPGAVAAALRLPGRQVLTFIGDGGMLMTGGELATAMPAGGQGGAPLKLIVSNNRSYGTIRLHQERDYPRRVSGTELANPDFAAWARSFGAEGITIESEAEIEDAVERALAAEGSVLLEVRSSLEAISAYTTLDKLRGGR
ncbi:MAG: thiamine pyrophosphate-dependent enzyme [Alphaproteobacteria bacterium]